MASVATALKMLSLPGFCKPDAAPSRGSVGGTRCQHPVHQAIGHGLLGIHEVVSLGVSLDGLDALSGVLGQQLVPPLADDQDLPGVGVDVGGLPVGSATGL